MLAPVLLDSRTRRGAPQEFARALEEVRRCPQPAASPLQIPEDLRFLAQLRVGGDEQSGRWRPTVPVITRGYHAQTFPDQVRRRQTVSPRTGERFGVLGVEANG